MNVLLINVDSRWNMAIRRMYAYYTVLGYSVEMIDLGFSAYPHKRTKTIDATGFNTVFVSNIFERNAHNVTVINCTCIYYGGIGSRNPDAKLPVEIEATKPFYYPEETVSYGFITRGCIRNCWFCKVPKYEGNMKEYNVVESIVRGVPNEKVKFLDNNILAYSNHCEVFQWLIDRNIRCEFNQGLDFRLVNDDNLSLLSKLNYEGEYIFAFDDPKFERLLEKKVSLIKKYIPRPWKLKFYIYHHPSMDISQTIRRVEWCRSHECLPYVMRDAACWECETKNFLIDYAAYCNQPSFFKNIDFEAFLHKRYKNQERISESMGIYNDFL